MALYTSLPIYRATYTLMLSLNLMMPNMPRDCRYTLGQDARRRVMDIIILIYNANRAKKKVPVIHKMQEALLEVQVYARLMNDMKYIAENRYLELMEQTSSISKQMAAWEKSERTKCGADTIQSGEIPEC